MHPDLSILKPYQERIERAIQDHLRDFGPPSDLKEACAYALSSGGKRFRPVLVYMMAEAIRSPHDVTDAALAVEYFHTASLLADDLPCMDDDAERRKRPATHVVFGEATALLASYALIAAGYEAIARCACHRPDVCALAIKNASFNTGILGATGGQFLDLYPPGQSREILERINHMKTVTLFEISFVFGWLFGHGAVDRLDLVKQAAAHFGRAFQLADDIDDLDQDEVNMATVLGIEEAGRLVVDELDQFFAVMDQLRVDSSEFRALTSLIGL